MYEDYFGLRKKPFSIIPDPGYFYMSEGHREALAHLMFGIKSDGGFVLLTGEVGTGKTTVCRRLLEVMPDDTEVAFILNPKLSAEELLATICDEFRIRYPEGTASIKTFVSLINEYLLEVREKGRRAVLIIEEAQNLSPEVLEQIRLLTNLETNEHKLLQMIMLGQPELRDMLSRPQLRQLSQRITARYHLGPLKKGEVEAYVNYRLEVAGQARGRLFPPKTVRRLYRLTGGVPRLINVVCDRALLGTFVENKEHVDSKTLTAAAREVTGQEIGILHGIRRYKIAGTAVLLACLILGAMYYVYAWKPPAAVVAPTAVAKAPEAAKPVSSEAATLERPADISPADTRYAAYTALLNQWRIEYVKDNRSVCRQAESQGLKCLIGKGSIANLRQMNRPAVLTLTDEKNNYYFATLTSLKGDEATVAVGSEIRNCLTLLQCGQVGVE